MLGVDGLKTRWSNYKSSLSVFRYFVNEFVDSWTLNNANRETAEKHLRERLTGEGLPDDEVDGVCREYLTRKDRLLGHTLFKDIYGKTLLEPASRKDALCMLLPGGKLLLKYWGRDGDGYFKSLSFELSRLMIFMVIASRLLAGDFYDVFGSGSSYLAYSLFFGVLPHVVNPGFTGSFKSVFLKSLLDVTHDSLVVSSSGLALAVHSVFGASKVPLYHLIPNSDLVAHFISGFGVGNILVRFFRALWMNISYTGVLEQVGSTVLYNEFLRYMSVSEVPLVCSFMLLIGFSWEVFEEIVENFTVRIQNQFFWNGVMDLVMDLSGAFTACAVIQGSKIFEPIKGAALFDEGKLVKAIDTVNRYIDAPLSNIYSTQTAENMGRIVTQRKGAGAPSIVLG